MDELIKQMKQLDKMIEDVSPLLVIDEWQRASELVPPIFAGLTNFLQLLIRNQNQLENINVDELVPLFEHLVYAMNVGDSIQIADILIYDIHNIFQGIYEQCGNV